MMRRMSEDGFTPDRAVYNWAIVACGQSAEWEAALDLLAEMRREGLRPDLYSYQMAMKVRREVDGEHRQRCRSELCSPLASCSWLCKRRSVHGIGWFVHV